MNELFDFRQPEEASAADAAPVAEQNPALDEPPPPPPSDSSTLVQRLQLQSSAVLQVVQEDFLAAMDAERDELRMRQLEMIDEPSELPMPVPQQPQQQESQISCLQNYVFPQKKRNSCWLDICDAEVFLYSMSYSMLN